MREEVDNIHEHVVVSYIQQIYMNKILGMFASAIKVMIMMLMMITKIRLVIETRKRNNT